MRYGFVIDQNRCIGCHACTVACKDEHDTPVGVFRTWVKYIEKGHFPNTSRHFGVMRCNHCEDAPCVEICPTQALHKRPDGIVDFDNSRCIGCKSCMQACPYEALHIDPRTNTAAKCNFCAHRVEVGIEPACVVVCPTRAIIAGDLDEPSSNVSRIVATQKVSTRKPHKGTRPKLFYVGIDGDLLDPGAMSRPETYLWGEKRAVGASADGTSGALDPSASPMRAREVFDVPHPTPWGWEITAYLWTKAIAAGVLMVAAILTGLGFATHEPLIAIASPAAALAFLGLTTISLILDLERPDRFHYILLKPNPRSWLVIGTYFLMAYGALSVAWIVTGILGGPPLALTIATGVAAAGCASYSAFLFGQGKGRDLWQSPLFFWHLIVDALIAGAATLVILGAGLGADRGLQITVGHLLPAFVFVGLAMILAEVVLPHVSEDVKRVTRMLTRGKFRIRFWIFAVALGAVAPIVLALVSDGGVVLNVIASVLALGGLWAFEDLWVKAGQSVPLS